MGNALRTDYILGPAAGYDPYRPKANALAIEDAEATIARKRAVGEGIRQENVLRQQDINRAPIENEAQGVQMYMKTRHMATPENWPAYRDFWIRAGTDPNMIPEQYDENYMKESDLEAEKFLREQDRKDAAAKLAEGRKETSFLAEEKRRTKRFEAEQTRAKEKFEFEQKKLKNKTDDAGEKDKANSARQFIQSLSKSTDDTFGLMIAAIATGGSLDPALIEQGESEIPESLKPAYDQAIRILEKYYGVPALQSQKQRMTFTREGGLQPIK